MNAMNACAAGVLPNREFTAKQIVWQVQNTSIPEGRSACVPIFQKSIQIRTERGYKEKSPPAYTITKETGNDSNYEIEDIQDTVLVAGGSSSGTCVRGRDKHTMRS